MILSKMIKNAKCLQSVFATMTIILRNIKVQRFGLRLPDRVIFAKHMKI